MELSTQALLFDAIQKGLNIEILDERDQFISLQFGEHLEYVKNGNMTSHDSYISPLIITSFTPFTTICIWVNARAQIS